MLRCSDAASLGRVAAWYPQPTALVQAPLQGLHGSVWVDDVQQPHVALLCCGDLLYPAGDVRHPAMGAFLDEMRPLLKPGRLLIPPDAAWQAALQPILPQSARAITRYALRTGRWKAAALEGLAQVPEGYALQPLQGGWVAQARQADWCQDWVSQYPTDEDYAQRGLGWCVLHDGRLAAGASSYVSCPGYLEIQVDTHPDERGRGLATAASAALILDCLRQGIHPGWDAANLTSRHIAHKLGYVDAGSYLAWLM